MHINVLTKNKKEKRKQNVNATYNSVTLKLLF